jgi:hypothetical protein
MAGFFYYISIITGFSAGAYPNPFNPFNNNKIQEYPLQQANSLLNQIRLCLLSNYI